MADETPARNGDPAGPSASGSPSATGSPGMPGSPGTRGDAGAAATPQASGSAFEGPNPSTPGNPLGLSFSTAPRPGLPPRWATGSRDLSAFDGLGFAARMARLAVVVILLVGAVLIAVVTVSGVGPPSKDDLIRQAGLLDKKQLLVGVKDDQPGLSLQDPKTGVYTGFDVEIAKLVAAELGFVPDDVRFLTIESEDRARRQALDTTTNKMVTVDLVVATFSITAERKKDPDVLFSAPYLRTEQTVLTRRTKQKIEALSDLANQTVCTLNTTTSMLALQAADDRPVGRNKISECVDGLRHGTYDAVSTDAAILAGFNYEYPKELQLHDIGLEASEDYGINVGPNPALQTLVNLALYKSLNDPADRRWENAYDTYLLTEQSYARPQQVAVSRQPMVAKPRVRTWPWEE
jgi:glutamate transport system substrate-binding protein